MYNPLYIANYFIKKANTHHDNPVIKQMDIMKLLNLVYLAQGWHLAFHNTSLLTENIEAWQYAPSVPTVYYQFKRYGGNHISETAFGFDSAMIKEYDAEFLDKVFRIYGKLNGMQLTTMTHYSGTPWAQTWNGSHSTVIKNNRIKNFYKSKNKKEDGKKGI